MTANTSPDTSVLAHPVWNALNGRQARFAIGDDLARRFHPEISPLCAARDNSEEALNSLTRLAEETGPLVTVQGAAYSTPPRLIVEKQRPLIQMIAAEVHPYSCEDGAIRLTASHAQAMLELSRQTRPGPFASLTGSLGQFWGIIIDGRLVAMSGERMHLPGLAEVSGVCTHPDYRGRGYARRLILRCMAQIADRGEMPFLQSYADNESATALYRSIGFSACGERSMTMLRAA